MALRTSISTSSACLPEMIRRPSMNSARAIPSTTIAATARPSLFVSWSTSAWSITSRPVIQISAIAQA